MKYFLAALALLFLTACNETGSNGQSKGEGSETGANAEGRAPEFQEFLNLIPSIELPYTYLTCREGTEGSEVFGNHRPTPYFKGYTYVRGWFPLENGAVGVISFAGADCMLPVLTTFSADGTEMGKETICIGRCGPGPCFECSEYSIIREDMSIYLADTMLTTECDEDFNEIPGGKVEKKVLYQEGSVAKDGKITLSEDQTKILSNQ